MPVFVKAAFRKGKTVRSYLRRSALARYKRAQALYHNPKVRTSKRYDIVKDHYYKAKAAYTKKTGVTYNYWQKRQFSDRHAKMRKLST